MAEDESRSSLKGSQNLLNILQNIPDAFLVLTPQLKIEEGSDAYLENTLTKREEILGKHIFDVFPDNPAVAEVSGVQNLQASFDTVLSTKKPHRMPIQHYDVRRSNGEFEEKYWSPINTPVLNEEGEVDFIIHRVRDVTESMKTEAALEIAIEAAQMGTWDLDLNNDFSGHRNFRHDQIFGYNTPQPKWSWDMAKRNILPEDQDIFDAAYSRAIETGKLETEVRVRWQDGSIHWMNIEGRFYFNESGKAIRGAGVNFDVSGRRKTEQSLRKSQDRLRKALSIETVGIIFFNLEGVIFDANSAFEKMSGFSKEDLAEGKVRWDQVTPPEFMDVTLNSREELLNKGENTPYEKEYLRADGSRWWGLFAGKRLAENECVEFVIDITETKKAEVALKEAKEEAEAATRAKEDFISTMSHEIRTPLNAVIGLTNLLLDQNPREDQKENLDSLSFSAKNLLTLINDILDFSKLEAGKMEIAENDFNLPDLLFSLKQAHQPLALENGTQLTLDLDEEIPQRISTDQLKLSQVLHNLVSNAIKFTSDGKVIVSAELAKRNEDVLWLSFAVTDTGIGIPKDKISHIFEKFSQAESSTVRHYGGTGLGLSISKLLLELLGGEIKVESKVGEGSRFYFNIPVKVSEKQIPSEEVKQKPGGEKDLTHMRLLLVEDVEINRKILMQFLKNWWQIKPDEAVNGKVAVGLAEKEQYDLILMDIRMPEMDGYEATNKIRKIPGHENTPILALTADKSQELQQTRQATQFDDLLIKPFDPRVLKQKIEHHLSILGGSSSGASESYTSKKEVSSEDDPLKSKEFLHLGLKNLKEYKQIFLSAVAEKNEKKLGEMVHKSKVLFQSLELEGLSETLAKARMLILENRNQELEKISKKGREQFEQAIKELDERTRETSFNLSKYTELSKGNKEVLQKLIGNSLRAIEEYKKQFTTAVNEGDLEMLSDLIHKNTTTLHYLQANRLDREIREYRTLMKDPSVERDELKQKKKLVLQEFERVIEGIRATED